MRVPRVVLLALTSLTLAAPCGWSQVRLTGGDLEGVVTDPSGAVLVGVAVTASEVDINLTREDVSGPDGRYRIPALPPGTYRLTAALDGFVTGVTEPVLLHVGQLADVSFELALAPVEAFLTVEAPVVSPFRTAVALVVGQRQIADLPINGRRFVGFAALSPGVVPAASTEAGADTSGLSFAGGRPVSNNLLVDGLDNNDRILGGANTSFSQEAVREFQVLTTSYPAEFGNATGGVLNIVTRSGTNERRGSTFGYFRDDALNARNYFERVDAFGEPVMRAKAPFTQAQWGGTLGLPLRRDRTFFFAAAERATTDASNFVTIAPDVAASLTAAGFPVQIGDVPYAFVLTQLSGKVDHYWTPTRILTVRLHGSDLTNENYRPFGGLVARSHAAAQYRADWGVSASQTDVFANRWVNEARVQYSAQRQRTLALDPTCGARCTAPMLGGPAVTLLGAATVGQSPNEPTDRLNRAVQMKNTVTRSGDRHTVKAGIDYTFIDQEALLSYTFGGAYVFAALPSIPGLLPAPVTALEAFQLGLPAYYTQGYGDGTSPFRYQEVAAFLQDDWRLGSRVTVKGGLRYQQQMFPDRRFTVSSVAGTSLTYPFPLGGPHVSPRIAAAYDPAGDGRTSVHAAYGLFFGNQLTAMYGVTDVFTRPDGTRLHLFPFPSSLGGWREPDRRLSDTGASLPRVTITIGPEARTPRVHQASVGVSRALTDDVVLTADAVYGRGFHQLGALEYNPLVPALGPGRRPNDIGGVPGTSTNVAQFTDFGESWYTGLLISLRKRLSSRHAFGVAYTWSRAEDNVSLYTGLVNEPGKGRDPSNLTGLPVDFDPAAERGRSANEQPHRLVVEGSWEAFGGIQVATVTTVTSGRVFTPLAGADLNGDGLPQADRARTNPLAAQTAVGRNSERMPYQAIVDIRLSRPLAVSRRVRATPMIEVFNLFNRTNYSAVNEVFGSGAYPSSPARDAAGRVTYGTFQQALPARQVQLALRMAF